MTWLIVLKFLQKYWKVGVVALVVGSIVIGVASLYSLWQLEKAQNTKLEAQLYAAETYRAVTQKNLDTALVANADWKAQGAAWTAATQRLEDEATAYTARLEAERQRRLAALRRTAELEAEVSSQITAADCETAVTQLITALGWSE